MTNDYTIFAIIEKHLDEMTDLERDIAAYFVQNQFTAETLSSIVVAEQLHVSQAALTRFAKKCGFKDKGYICYEEDAQESVVLRELLDKKLWKIPDRIKDKGQFEEKLNQSIRQYHPEYWRARQSGREAAEAARSTAPAKEAAR